MLENLDPNNFKALMRRAFANRSQLNFKDALADLKQLKKVMDSDDAALQEVEKMYKSCWRGICQANETIPEISVRRMMRTTANWITQYREKPDDASKIAYLKSCPRDNIRETFRNIPVPRCIFASIVEVLEENCRSIDDLTWAQSFMVSLRDTLDFDAEVLCTTLEYTNVRLERLSRRLK